MSLPKKTNRLELNQITKFRTIEHPCEVIISK